MFVCHKEVLPYYLMEDSKEGAILIIISSSTKLFKEGAQRNNVIPILSRPLCARL